MVVMDLMDWNIQYNKIQKNITRDIILLYIYNYIKYEIKKTRSSHRGSGMAKPILSKTFHSRTQV